MILKTIKILFLVIILILPIVTAQEYDHLESLEMSTSINLGVIIEPEIGGFVKNFEANITLIPSNTFRQKINNLDIRTSPPKDSIIQKDNYVILKWNNPETDEIIINIKSDIISKNRFNLITSKIKFPITNLPPELIVYTQPSETIDITPEMERIASEIAAGETDLYVVVFKTSEWVKKEVPYNLNTLTATAAQKSSWVLENKQGVCDEITGLFISLLRSIGIPARFISGQVYSNTIPGWGNHGWAEVYFPGHGWVPFDPTFGQDGWLDPTHIEFKKSQDTNEPAAFYKWQAYKVHVETKEIEINTKLTDQGNKLDNQVKLTAKILNNEVGPSSFVPLEVTVENLKPYYVSTIITITKAPGLIGKNFQQILLKPNEVQKLYWILKTPSDVDKGFIYKATIETIDSFKSKAETELIFGNSFPVISAQEAKDKINLLTETTQKTISKDVKVDCRADKNYYYTNETINVYCEITNQGNILLENLNLCLKNNCYEFDLLIAAKTSRNFTISAENNLIVNIKNNEIDQSESINVNILKPVTIKIEDLEYQKEISYNTDSELKFLIEVDTTCKNTIVDSNLGYAELGQIENKKSVTLNFKSNNILNNNYIKIICYDLNDKPFSKIELLDIKLTNIPFHIKILKYIQNLFSNF